MADQPTLHKREKLKPSEPSPEAKPAVPHQEVLHYHNTAIHTENTPSLLTSSSEEQNFRGFFNLAAIILVVSHARIVIENFMKYGILLNLSTLRTYVATDDLLVGMIGLQIHVLVAFFLEKWAVGNKHKEQLVHWGNIINVSLCVLIPCTCVYYARIGPVGGAALLALAFVLFMKLISYNLVNRDFRHDYWKGKAVPEAISERCRESLVTYPQNLTFSNLYYFLAAPVLVYQMNYPRTKKIRWYWLMGKVGQFIFCTCLQLFILEQFIMPTIKNTLTFMVTPNLPALVARLLKLSVRIGIRRERIHRSRG
eukprot:TRINITY_DN2530_c0_g2_i2.p1 TRINITY_DN2530_c0_g2~~TRINITY_DN2530_c0_g2_i2.p1  ORF type:complete len:310 (+),score=19.80 TRINITY_DN2530_c0_g2_i2:70-999(+)